MFIPTSTCILASLLCLPSVLAFKHHNRTGNHTHFHSSENVVLNHQAVVQPASPMPLGVLKTNQLSIAANTSFVTTAKVPTVQAVTSAKVDSTVLVIARDTASAYSAYSGLNDRGIPYTVLIVPQAGAALPSLNDTATQGNFGLIVVLSEVSYNYGTKGFASALTTAQWTSLYAYQVAFGVRMVRLDVAPSADTGTQSLGSCCTGEQLISISNATAFPQAGLNVGAGLTTKGLYHYPAKITNPKIAWEIAQFGNATADNMTTTSTAAVINVIDGRQQMVFFLPFATDWSLTSIFLQHAWITWGTRGLFVGWRRAMLNTQVDDMFLETPMFDTGENFRCSTVDVAHHITVMAGINKRLPAGSNWFMEIGHNGNGNIETADKSGSDTVCNPGPIEYPDQIDTPLEFAKPLGSGTSIWPANESIEYGNYSLACLQKDALLVWWQNPTNLNAFAHISHTFTHEDQDNSTYYDVVRELTWNKAWLDQSGISKANRFSSTGIIPPAITGMHNGDALRAWYEQGIVHVVGDNTRKPLLNADNEHWPLMSTVASNGYAGIQITPRWASNIYYNCNYADCVVAEWKNVSKGVGDMYTILGIEQETNTRHLLGLHHDPYMFHQANLMYEDADFYTTPDDITTVYSLLEVWHEYVVREYIRLVNWPLISIKHDDINASFRDRMTRDACKPKMSWDVSPSTGAITGVTVTTTRNTCSVPIPITVPASVTDTQGFTTEQLGHDPLTIWVKMTGQPVSFTLSKTLALN